METQHWLETAKDDGYLPVAEHARRVGLCEEIGRMLGGMMENSASFRDDSAFREEPPPYRSSRSDATPPIPADHRLLITDY